MQNDASALSTFKFRISRMALATVPTTKTVANAQRLIFSTLIFSNDKALVILPYLGRCQGV
jgi:hypothetical protein